jgi:hypothetical protein
MRCREADGQGSGLHFCSFSLDSFFLFRGLRLLAERLSLLPPLLSSDRRRERSRDRVGLLAERLSLLPPLLSSDRRRAPRDDGERNCERLEGMGSRERTRAGAGRARARNAYVLVVMVVVVALVVVVTVVDYSAASTIDSNFLSRPCGSS